MICRCGHGRSVHRPTPNALAKRRARVRIYGHNVPPCRLACQYITRFFALPPVHCTCRHWHPEEVNNG